jgi:hypothetical protein
MKRTLFALSALALPTLVMAQNGDIDSLLGSVGGWLDTIVGLLFALAVLGFFWGLALYIFKADSEAKSKGINIMIMGTIALFVMASIYGIIGLLQSSFDVQGSEDIDLPDPTIKN